MSHQRKILVSVSPAILIRATLAAVTNKAQTFSSLTPWEFSVHVTVWKVKRSERQLYSAQSPRVPSLWFRGAPAWRGEGGRGSMGRYPLAGLVICARIPLARAQSRGRSHLCETVQAAWALARSGKAVGQQVPPRKAEVSQGQVWPLPLEMQTPSRPPF